MRLRLIQESVHLTWLIARVVEGVGDRRLYEEKANLSLQSVNRMDILLAAAVINKGLSYILFGSECGSSCIKAGGIDMGVR